MCLWFTFNLLNSRFCHPMVNWFKMVLSSYFIFPLIQSNFGYRHFHSNITLCGFFVLVWVCFFLPPCCFFFLFGLFCLVRGFLGGGGLFDFGGFCLFVFLDLGRGELCILKWFLLWRFSWLFWVGFYGLFWFFCLFVFKISCFGNCWDWL